MNDPRGSFWRKWDLHVHTPASLHHNYPGPEASAWDAFIADLEALPSEFKVIGVNDYLFLDGYRRLVAEKAKGRLPNIHLLLPVIELRIDKFGGTQGALSRLNLHVIFSNSIAPETIEAQFIAALFAKYKLTPEIAGIAETWNAVPTRDSLRDLGNMLIESAPPSERAKYGSPLKEGFDALNFSMETVHEALTKHYFKGKTLTSVGKTEWANIKWSGSVAEKKTIVNSCDFLFCASDTPGAFEAAVRSLESAGVNSRLLHCSDAHALSASQDKDRVGHCFCWIKADTTFEGLRLASYEYGERVFVGDEPPKIEHLRGHLTKYVKSVALRKRRGSTLSEKWFDATIQANPGLVAVIGNKGSGKSALADAIGLAGETRQGDYFSFLTDERFRDPKANKASQFEVTPSWYAGDPVTRALDADPDPASEEKTKYLPQKYLEAVCNEVPGAAAGFFDRELKGVIFSHVPEPERLGRDSLDALAEYAAKERVDAISFLRQELTELNRAIVSLETQGTGQHRKSLENELAARHAELSAHETARPPVVPQPAADVGLQAAASALTEKLKSIEQRVAILTEKIASTQRTLGTAAARTQLATKVLARLTNLQAHFTQAVTELTPELKALDLDAATVLHLAIDRSKVELAQATADGERKALSRELDPTHEGGLAARHRKGVAEAEATRALLDEPNRRYQGYLEATRQWEQKRVRILGAADRPGTLEYARARLELLSQLPTQLASACEARRQKTARVHGELQGIAEVYRALYRPVQDFIRDHKLATDQFRLVFDVSIVEKGLAPGFFDIVSRAAAGYFRGVDEGEKALHALVSRFSLNDANQVVKFCEELVGILGSTGDEPEAGIERISAQLRGKKAVAQLYDYVFGLEYLTPRYTLKLGDRDLRQLSPGEKGALLLVFYLLVDKGDIPLVIDQPEENLDNQTVYDLLVPSIREAKRRRQIFMVTHNPNLAVVCDAEQIVFAHIDRQDGNRITYESGALENPSLRKHVIDVLEGTQPAFRNREDKYSIGT